MPTPPTSGSGAGACARGSRDPTPSSRAATPSSDPTPSSAAAAETTEATQDQGTSYVTANLFFPKVCAIYLAIKKWQSSGIPIIEEMSVAMKDKFMKYWTDVHGLMAAATVLDPRYKMKFLYAMYSQIYGAESMHIEVMKVKDLLVELVKEYQGSMEGCGTTDGDGAAGSSSAVQNEGDIEVNEIFDKYLSSEPALPTYVSSELDMYLEEEILPRSMKLDIISYWNVGAVKFHTLRKIARDIMAIPVTTVASESVFSTSGRIISPNRSRLSPKMVEGLMCMQAWSRAEMLGPESPALNALMTRLDDEEEELDEPESDVIDP